MNDEARSAATGDRGPSAAAAHGLRVQTVRAVLDLMAAGSLPMDEWPEDVILPHSNGYSVRFSARENDDDGHPISTAPPSGEYASVCFGMTTPRTASPKTRFGRSSAFRPSSGLPDRTAAPVTRAREASGAGKGQPKACISQSELGCHSVLKI